MAWCDDQGRWCRILVVVSWQDKHNDISNTVKSLFCQELLILMISWPVVISYGLCRGHRLEIPLDSLPSCNWNFTDGKLYHACWRRRGFRFEDSQQGTLALLGRDMTSRTEDSSTNKDHRNLPPADVAVESLRHHQKKRNRSKKQLIKTAWGSGMASPRRGRAYAT